ncbi:related to pre-mrna splicing factor srp55 [Serendipita indica DSM 11827]|uniref:Related to pre-mrna splicing factor srp55 n=1 Tax=Serendipita indica (strain DSM 11827) TaxID=1109443 RepID=G4TQA8_SERID|nr:related to pre-mrna splicing factor srp55 [Serendipita indica DSM 11827]
MSRRLYVGKLPPDVNSEDVRRFFEDEARVKVVDCRIMTGFGFIEFDSSEDMDTALRLDGHDFQGQPILVQVAREKPPRREPPREMRSSGRRQGVTVIVSNVSRDVSWQDLKDFGREAGGGVIFSDIDRDVPNQGILEYYTAEEAERAVRELDGRELRGHTVTLRLQDSRGGGRRDRYNDDYRRDNDDYRRDNDD